MTPNSFWSNPERAKAFREFPSKPKVTKIKFEAEFPEGSDHRLIGWMLKLGLVIAGHLRLAGNL